MTSDKSDPEDFDELVTAACGSLATIIQKASNIDVFITSIFMELQGGINKDALPTHLDPGTNEVVRARTEIRIGPEDWPSHEEFTTACDQLNRAITRLHEGVAKLSPELRKTFMKEN